MNRISKILICLWITLMTQVTFAQNTLWMSPSCSNNVYDTGLTIANVEFYSNATIINFIYENSYTHSGWVQLSRACKLKAYPSGKIYTLTSAVGIPYAPTKHYFSSEKELLEFTCIFPAVPTGTTHVDWIEEGDWAIYNIKSKSGINVNHSFGRNYVHSAQNATNASSYYSTTSSSTSGNNIKYDKFDITKKMSFTAYASSFCYPTGNGQWSEFSEWKNCDFEIEYNPNNDQFVFYTAKVQKYKVEDCDSSDPSITSFQCRDEKNVGCEIDIATMPDDDGVNQIYLYLRFDDEQLCYVLRKGSPNRISELTTIPTQGAQGRALPEIMTYPSYSKAYTNSGMTLTKVVANNSQTVLDFEYIYSDNQTGGIWLSPNTCIRAYPSGYKYTVSEVEGIELSPSADEQHYKGEKAIFRAYFSAMPANTTHFDFMEEGESSDWVLCGISNTPEFRKDFLLLNSTYGDHNVTWEWYGGSKTFYVATTATDYDIIGLPSWIKVSNKVDEGFKIECQSGGEEYSSDYFLVRAKGQEVRVNVTRKKYNEYSSPSGSFTDFSINHYSYTKKITITPNAILKNFSGRKCSVGAFLMDSNGNLVTSEVEEFTPTSNNYTLSNITLTIDYSTLNINNLAGYTVACALYDEVGQGFFALSDTKTVIQKSRSDIASAIRGWGKCRVVAITEANGDIAINGTNGYTSNGLPPKMLDDIKEIRDKKEIIQDITLTEKGDYVIIWGNNGVRLSNIPDDMYEALKKMNSQNEIITSAVFNDNGDWIVISDKHYNASSQELVNFISEGAKNYGLVYSACLTNNALIIVYDKGYRSKGNIPESLSKAINGTNINVYRIKIAGNSWFFADKEGNYRMSL